MKKVKRRPCKTDISVGTWLPLFSGFYNTIWQSDSEEDYEIERVNEERAAKGWKPVKWDSFEFDYPAYNLRCVNGITNYLERELKEFVTSISIEGIKSPKEYNFVNDSANVTIVLSRKNVKAINTYLSTHSVEFAAYLKETYTSRSGFISHWPNTVEAFMAVEVKERYYSNPPTVEKTKPLEHRHKLGSILDFICGNEDITEMGAWERSEKYLEVINYDHLINTEVIE